MIMRLRSQQIGWMFRLLRLWFASALFVASITPSWASAQSKDDPWVEPLNLSHAGIAIDPVIVVDSEGVVRVVWQDNLEAELANYVYTQFDGDQWSPPEKTDLAVLFRAGEGEPPENAQSMIYTGPNPLLLAGPGQYTFAFWISSRGFLFTSKARNANFDDLYGWDTRRLITPDAVSFAAAIDSRGGLHLAFFDTVDDPETPAGLYYTRSKSSGGSWSVPVLLYKSPYLRRLGEGEANLSLATVETEDAVHVYIAWDNRPRKQVLLAQSADGGENWAQPEVVEGPAPNSGLAGPLNIRIGANQKSIVLVWQSGRVTSGLLPACSQIYKFSSDAGMTWSDPQTMADDLWGCAQSNEFVTGLANSPESPLYLLTEAKSQVFLTAWNGLYWSEPQPQPILSGFEEPEIYTDVIYGCRQASLFGERLYVIGCDEGGGGDVWVTSRALAADTSWFEPPVWGQLSPVTSDNLEIETIELVATVDDLIHAFFSLHQDPVIYYTYWDGELWSRTIPVLELPEGVAGTPAIATGPENELFLVVPNNKGALYFSRATSGKAVAESRWSPPTQLGTGHDGEIGSVDVAWDAAGTVYVTYSVPVNDNRGIYMVQSNDNGTSWSEPLEVFNGGAAGFDLVGAPSFLASENGFLHIIWKRQSIEGDGVSQPLSLYYSRSEDGGRTFSDAETVVEDSVAWREIVADDKGNLHLLWQPQDTMTTVWDQISFDGGRSWEIPQGLPGEGMATTITVDSVGRLHLVAAGLGTLGHWLWDGSRWQPEAPLRLSLASQRDALVERLAVAVNKQGKMVVAFAIPTTAGNAAEMNLLYSSRSLKLPPRQTATEAVPTQTLLSPTLTPSTPSPEPLMTPTATVDNQAVDQGEIDRVETTNSLSPLTMALLPVALLLLGVLGFVIRRVTREKLDK